MKKLEITTENTGDWTKRRGKYMCQTTIWGNNNLYRY